MGSKIIYDFPAGVLGMGSFGTAVANLVSQNAPVILYGRNPDTVSEIRETRISNGQRLSDNIEITSDLEYVAGKCTTLFPVVPSSGFRDLIRNISPFLRPYHILIHGTKGFDLTLPAAMAGGEDHPVSREHVHTMSEVIMEETVAVRVGCLAGPNLARELSAGLPGATVVASNFNEVIHEGQRLLRSDKFQVYGNNDLIGIELSGVLKNIIAIASGAVSGLELGENARGLLLSRGMVEMIYLGRILGGNIKAFLGLAGIGDLVTTCTSSLSRNFSVGYRLARGEKIKEIMSSMDETAEGINTVRLTRNLAKFYKLRAPITEKLYEMMYHDLSAEMAVQYLMKYPLNIDVDFL